MSTLFELIFNPSTKGVALPANQTGKVPNYLAMDAVISEAPSYTASPTESVVETGETISDHVTQKPDKLTLKCVISNTPVGLLSIAQGQTFQDRVGEAHRLLKALKASGQPCDWVGGLEVYHNMVIVEYSTERNKTTANTLTFSLVLQKILQVSSQLVAAQNFSPAAAANGAGGTKNNGSQATSPASDTSKSVAAKLYDNGVGFFFGARP